MGLPTPAGSFARAGSELASGRDITLLCRATPCPEARSARGVQRAVCIILLVRWLSWQPLCRFFSKLDDTRVGT